MNVVLVGPVSHHVTERYVFACRDNGWRPVILGTPAADLARYRHLADCAEVPSLEVPIGQLASLVAAYQPAAVVPAGELAVPIADRLAAKLGLPHNPLDRLQVYREKDAMRAAFAAAGVCQPTLYATYSSLASARDFDWSTVTFPVIAKPVDASASYFVARCDVPAEVLRALPHILAHGRSQATGLPFRQRALIEEFVAGPEYSADCVIADGRPEQVFLRQKLVSPYPHCDIVAHLAGQVLNPSLTERVHRAIERIVRAYAVRDTVMHVEFKFAQATGEVCVIEAGNRMGGDRVADLVELCHGWDLAEALVRLRAGWPLSPAYRADRVGEHSAYAIRFLFTPGRDVTPPPGVVVIRREAIDHYSPAGHHGPFHVSRRIGYELIGGDDVDVLRNHLVRSCDTAACASPAW